MTRLGMLCVLICVGCSFEAPPSMGDPAPQFELERLDGSPVQLETYRGKYLLIDFWATWCPPCVLEIPELNAFYSEHQDLGVEVLAISIDRDDPEKLRLWAEEKSVLYPVAIADTDLARAYGAAQFPFHVLIGPDGTILERLTPGYHDREELRTLLAKHRGS